MIQQIIPIALPICNVFLLQGDRPILIDSGRPQDADAVERALRIHNVPLRQLSLLLHTHGHWDHCGSTYALRGRALAPHFQPETPDQPIIAIHHADADMMRRGDNGPLKPATITGRLLRPFLNRSFPAAEPTLLIHEEIDLSPFGVDARIYFTPGHTAGSISVLTAEMDIIVGDLLMGGFLGGKILPRRPGLHYFADDLVRLRQSVNKVLELKPRRILTGHGGPLDPNAVETWLLRWRP